MKEIGLIFKAEMVKAILAGRKTQTRQLKFSGKPGDLIWVRETHWRFGNLHKWCGSEPIEPYWKTIKPDITAEGFNPMHYVSFIEHKISDPNWIKVPSIFMPRWASRITLEVTEVREQRLQEITCEDCRAEGLTVSDAARYALSPENIAPWRIAFRELWNKINGKRASWESDPVVKAVTFRRVK